MNKTVKYLWLSDLRDPKNVQGKKSLRNDTGDCCLGRLCELYRQVHNEGEWVKERCVASEDLGDSVQTFIVQDDRSDIRLPHPVQLWAGLEGSDPIAATEDPGSLRDGQPLSNLNDGGLAFPQIADVIEYFL